MLYSEFVQGTGCRENDHNFQIYKRLEMIYMNDDTCTKEDIYNYGKKLVDNTPSAEELAQIQGWKEEIADLEKQIQEAKKDAARYHLWMLEADTKEDARTWKDAEKTMKDHAKYLRGRVADLRFLLTA